MKDYSYRQETWFCKITRKPCSKHGWCSGCQIAEEEESRCNSSKQSTKKSDSKQDDDDLLGKVLEVGIPEKWKPKRG